MGTNRPKVTLDAFPVRARIVDRRVDPLVDALTIALALPSGWTLHTSSVGWVSRGTPTAVLNGPLDAGLRIVAIKKHKRTKTDLVAVSYAAFDAKGGVVAWSDDVDVEIPSKSLMELEVRDASGKPSSLPDASRAVAETLGLAVARVVAKKAAKATRILVAEAPLWVVGVSPDGTRCTSADQRSVLSLWDTATGELLAKRSIGGARTIAEALAHSHDGSRIATGVRPLLVADARTLETVLEIEVPKSASVGGVAWSHDDRFLAATMSRARRANVGVWDARTGERVLSAEHHTPCRIAFTPSGDAIVVGGFGATVQFALATGATVHESDEPAADSLVWIGDAWAIGTEAGKIALLGPDLAPAGTFPIPKSKRAARMAVDRARRTLVVGEWQSRELVLVDLASRTVRARVPLPVVDGVVPSLQGVAISDDGSTIAATAGSAVALYDADGRLKITPRVA